ncbi:hypothetical protein VT85_15535 [Planctomyces sp. SH-PL62]|nr:hypothetical protein VT85_15535 [Planctomyces sp. SH-PL62]
MTSYQTADLLLGLVAAVAVASTLASTCCLLWVTRRARNLPDHTPPVTIFKPLKGLDEELEANLASFFALDYPTYQLLFCVADAADPAAAVVRKLMEEHPEQDARLVVGCPPFGLNPKVESLAAMEPFRRHDILLISDSNVRAQPTYLRETACHLADPSVGLVTNLFVGKGEIHAGAVMENLQLNGFIAGGMAMASMLGVTCVVGKSMMLRASVLEAIGGFAAVRNLLAEDQVIGMLVRKAGYSIRLSRHVIENVNRRRGFTWFLNRHSRWYKIRRRLALPVFAVEPLSNLAAIGLVWAFSGDSGFAWGGLLGLVGLGMARDAIQTRWLGGSFPKLRHLIYSPIKDLMLLPLWFDALLNSHVQWRGHRFYVGRLTRLMPDPTARPPVRSGRRSPRVHGGSPPPHRPTEETSAPASE